MEQTSFGMTKTSVEKLKKFNDMDIVDICDATIATMEENVGFNIGAYDTGPMQKEKIAAYWEGVLLVPERVLIVCRLDGNIAGALQIVRPSSSNRTSQFACSIDNHFIAPWARGYNLSDKMLELAEKEAKVMGYDLIKLSVRSTREAAIKIYEKRGYERWGVLPKYELDKGKIVSGYFYSKEL